MEPKWMGTAYPHVDEMSDEALTQSRMTRESYSQMVTERAARDRSAPVVGADAPDFALERIDRNETRRGEVVRLSARRGRPVALAFGSITAPPFRDHIPHLNEVYERHRDRVDFFTVYIQEAHPGGGWQVQGNEDDGLVFAAPESLEERAELARMLIARFDVAMPVVVDNVDDEVDTRYAALPLRLYLIDEGGTVVFRTPVGSPGFDVDSWERAIEGHVHRG
jgi:thiol-disulfide isomerase/thioredoxin